MSGSKRKSAKRPVRRTAEQRLQTIEKLLELLGSDVVRLIERMPATERVQAELAATREHLAVTGAACRRLLGEKQALIAYTRVLEERINAFEHPVTDWPINDRRGAHG